MIMVDAGTLFRFAAANDFSHVSGLNPDLMIKDITAMGIEIAALKCRHGENAGMPDDALGVFEDPVIS